MVHCRTFVLRSISVSHIIILLNTIFVNKSSGQYVHTFKPKNVQRVTLISLTNELAAAAYNQNYLATLNYQERKALCNDAYLAEKLPFLKDEYVFEAEMYRFTFSENEEFNNVGIKCPTLPAVYITSSPPSEPRKVIETTVLFVDPYTKGFSFDLEVIRNLEPIQPLEAGRYIPIGFSSSKSWDEEVEADIFYFTEPEDRWNLCFIASQRIHRKIKFDQETDIAEPKLYKSNIGVGVAFAAIDCKTTPSMHLRLKRADSENPVIKMIFLERELINSEQSHAEMAQ